MATVTYAELAKLPALRRFYRLIRDLFGVNVALCSPALTENARYRAPGGATFCHLLHRQKGGLARCLECDHAHFRTALSTGRALRYRCHAGLTEFIIPIVLDGDVVALLQSGQILDKAPTPRDWSAIQQRFPSPSQALAALRKRFFATRVIPPGRQGHLMEMLEIFGHEIARGVERLHLLESGRTSQIVVLAQSHIKRHYAEPLPLHAVARAAGTSARTLTRLFLPQTGRTVLEYIHQVRIGHACEMLLGSRGNCTAIAHACGFGTIQQFNRIFRRFMEIAPLAWRRRQNALAAIPRGTVRRRHAREDGR